MPVKNLLLIALLCIGAVSCNSNPDKSANEPADPRETPLPTTGMSKEQQLTILISDSKKTLDSIDAAYKNITAQRASSQGMDMYEKEQVNEALMELNDAKDLIVLQTQEAVISQLKEKTTSLQGLIQKMNSASARCKNIANTVSRISGIIEKTTNALASALTAGIIRPPLPPAVITPVKTTTTTAPTTSSPPAP